LSVDLEDWYAGVLLLIDGRIDPPSEVVVRSTERLLELFDEYGVKATFFVLGDVATAYPKLVKSIADAGHELGVHGYHHHRIYQLTREEFRDAIVRAKAAVEDAGQVAVHGFRAVEFSVPRDPAWFYEALRVAGFSYSSSVFPFAHPRFGKPGSPAGAHRIQVQNGEMWEVPLSVLGVGSSRLPCCGGGYLRHFPLLYTSVALDRLEREGRPAVVYLHPYELETWPRLGFFRHEVGVRKTLRLAKLFLSQLHGRRSVDRKLRKLLACRSMAPLSEVFPSIAPIRSGLPSRSC
jgi:polysaccharide deacetylase family protein (PEP-CTERM system associated)